MAEPETRDLRVIETDQNTGMSSQTGNELFHSFNDELVHMQTLKRIQLEAALQGVRDSQNQTP